MSKEIGVVFANQVRGMEFVNANWDNVARIDMTDDVMTVFISKAEVKTAPKPANKKAPEKKAETSVNKPKPVKQENKKPAVVEEEEDEEVEDPEAEASNVRQLKRK